MINKIRKLLHLNKPPSPDKSPSYDPLHPNVINAIENIRSSLARRIIARESAKTIAILEADRDRITLEAEQKSRAYSAMIRRYLLEVREVNYGEPGSPGNNQERLNALAELMTGLANRPPGSPDPNQPPLQRSYLHPDEAQKIPSDRYLHEEWLYANIDISRVYEILGPPPLKTLSGTQRDK
jgi:hypothetical protein